MAAIEKLRAMDGGDTPQLSVRTDADGTHTVCGFPRLDVGRTADVFEEFDVAVRVVFGEKAFVLRLTDGAAAVAPVRADLTPKETDAVRDFGDARAAPLLQAFPERTRCSFVRLTNYLRVQVWFKPGASVCLARIAHAATHSYIKRSFIMPDSIYFDIKLLKTKKRIGL